MSSNMIFQASSGTFTLVTNPFPYRPYVIELEDNERSVSGALINYHKASYSTFELIFSNIGTADYTNLKTMFDNHGNIEFYPYDEVRGTALHYTCRWIGDFKFDFADSFYNSGFAGNVLLEQC